MHPFDDPPDPPDPPESPDADRALAVIDATLAGEPVDPQYAELAELSLILAGQRPVPSPAFSAALDDRVTRRFATPARADRARGRRRWLYAQGAVAAVAVAVAAVLVLSSGGGGSGLIATDAAAPAASSSASASSTSSSSAAASGASSSSATSPASSSVPQAAASAPSPAPPTQGRQIVQSAQLSLSARPGRIDDLAQQVFDVVSGQHGVVDNSNVTANGAAGGYAQFELGVPSANLQATMSALSALRGAAVLSRTDSSQDITGQVGGAGRRLADARALRTTLLRRLATASTVTEIGSLRSQIRDAEASINSDLATLRSLHGKVDMTQISVTINAALAPGHRMSGSAGFTIGRAVHDAGRVLVIAAGVALIALAVLVPLGLLAAMIAWLGLVVRRRRREQALDLL